MVIAIGMAALLVFGIFMVAAKLNHEDEVYEMGYQGALLAIQRGADPLVVLESSLGEGSLNRGARDAARMQLVRV